MGVVTVSNLDARQEFDAEGRRRGRGEIQTGSEGERKRLVPGPVHLSSSVLEPSRLIDRPHGMGCNFVYIQPIAVIMPTFVFFV